jgi:hypothetical protein
MSVPAGTVPSPTTTRRASTGTQADDYNYHLIDLLNEDFDVGTREKVPTSETVARKKGGV